MRPRVFWSFRPPHPSRILLVLLVLAGGCGGPETAPPSAVSPYDSFGRPVRPISRPSSPMNLVLVVIDTLRADALAPEDARGEPPRMPSLSALAARGVSFRNAAAAASWTLPSMTSLLTGLLPSAHGLLEADLNSPLVPAIVTYAEVLKEAYGYQTAAFVDGPWFQGLGETTLQGFAHRDLGFAFQGGGERVAAWARSRSPERPFFLLLHTFEAHAPYGAKNHPWPRPASGAPSSSPPTALRPDSPPGDILRVIYLDEEAARGVRAAFGTEVMRDIVQRYEYEGFAADPDPALAADLEAAYWDGVRWVDGLLGQLLGLLERLGLFEHTLLVVASDHGETFGTHGGLGHGRLLYDELIRVPLVMLGPEPFRGGRVLEGSVGLVDVLPTFFDLAGLVPPDGTDGRSARPLLGGEAPCRPVLSEELLSRKNTGMDVDRIRVSARTERWKYILTFDARTGDVREEAYDLWTDPAEKRDLADGAGRLGAGLGFDDCFCPAVDLLRSHVWGLPTAGEDAASIPYGVTRSRVTAPPPPPCRPAPR